MTLVLVFVSFRVGLGLVALGMFGIALGTAIWSTQIVHEIDAAKRAGFSGLIPLRQLRRNYAYAAGAFLSSVSASVIVIATLVVIP